ncbi:MAG: MFS transporter [Chloroflexi bacterium]|nr:MFS transporter [Chloroflexota bacterium]
MLALVFLTLATAAAVRSLPGVLIIPLEREFPTWDRATISLAVSINLLLYGLCGPFASSLANRFGMRRTMVTAFSALGVAVGLTTLMREAWQLQLLWGVVVGAGTGVAGAWMAATVSSRWFVKHQGLVGGLLFTGSATGQIVFLPLLASVVVAMDWRVASLIVAGFALLVVPLAAKFVYSHPQEIGLQPYGAPPATDGKAAEPLVTPRPAGNPFVAAFKTLRQCIGKRDFLLLSGTFFACGASANGLIGTHLIPASMEHDIPEVAAASLLSFMAVLNICGSIAAGWLSDRVDCRWLLGCYYGLRGLSLLFLPFIFTAVDPYPGLMVFAAFYGLEWAATAVPTMRLTADIFGRANVGTIFAWVTVSHQLGAGAVSLGAGMLRTSLGNYSVAFVISGFICLIAAGMALLIRRPAGGEPVPAPVAVSERPGVIVAPAARR